MSVIRLDTVDLGESRRWQTIGSNLDGLCTLLTAPTSPACVPPPGATPGAASDGPAGIDNAFGKHLVPMLQVFFGPDVSAKVAGHSWLAFEGDGRATLYVGDDTKVRFVIPLLHARLSAPKASGLSTLTGVIPREQLAGALLARANLLGGQRECGSTTMVAIAETVRRMADIPLSGKADPQYECDAISFAMDLAGTSAIAAPKLPPECGAPMPVADQVLSDEVVESDP